MDQTVLSFADLLTARPGEEPGDTQRRAADELPVRAAESRLHWWAAGDPVPAAGRRLLIGVGVWSGYDLRLLDGVDAALAGRADDLTVDLFDLGAVGTQGGFQSYIPGLGAVLMTPVAGLWRDGRLLRSAVGHPARELVAAALGVPVGELLAPRALHPVAS